MVRKSLFIVLSAVVVLSVSVVGWAQDVWKWNEFNADYERFYYESVTYTSSWDWELGEEVEIEGRPVSCWSCAKWMTSIQK